MSDKLDLFFMPHGQDLFVLPVSRVDNVFPFANPIGSYSPHACLIGAFIYQDRKVPIVDLTVLLPHLQTSRRLSKLTQRRLIVIKAISSRSLYPYYAFSSSMPRIIDVDESHIEELNETNLSNIFYSKIRVNKEYSTHDAYVLNLEYIEETYLSTL